jgi:hypothetical protein
MGEAVARQHPAVVLRSQFDHLRALVAVALIAVAGLTVAVAILASDSDELAAGTRGPVPAALSNTSVDESTRGPLPAALPKTSVDESARGPLPAGLPKTSYEGETADVTPAKPRTADVPPGQPRIIQQQGSPALVNQSGEATGDYAHGPLPPAAPSKDYSKNGATGDYSTEPEAQTGSRADGAPDKILQLRARAGN